MAWTFLSPIALVAAAVLLAAPGAKSASAGEPNARHTSLSLLGKPKQPEGFSSFAWVNPEAPKGGRVRLWAMGTFDSLNRYSIKGSAEGRLDLTQATLMASVPDEESTVYAHIAAWISYPEDFSAVTFGLNKDARFSDGSPVTADDVVFSLGAVKAANPRYGYYYKNVVSADKTGDNEVTFKFDVKGNRELPLIVGELPVLSKAYWTGKGSNGELRDVTKSSLEIPVGAGPYRVKAFEAGRTITYERIKDWWGKDTPVMKGQWNFDEVSISYFRDRVPAFEAFKAGDIDFWRESSAKSWATAFDFDAVSKGLVKLDKIPTASVAPMQAFTFNIRRPQFQDVRVRKAFNLAFDFEWANKNLFYDQYVRVDSYFGNSELQAKGLPQGKELAMLEGVRAQVPADVFTTEWKNANYNAPEDVRRNLSAASKLLAEAGWAAKNGVLTNAAGQQLSVEFLLVSPDFERVVLPFKTNLEKLGVKSNVRVVDSSQYQRRQDAFDYDIIVSTFAQSQSPGNEQRDFWGTEAATHEGSHNLVGIKNPAVDALVDKIIMAPSREDLVTATQALDRVLLWNYYVIPQWHFPFERVAYWDRYGRPKTLASRNSAFLQTWWVDAAAAQRLGGAR